MLDQGRVVVIVVQHRGRRFGIGLHTFYVKSVFTKGLKSSVIMGPG